MPEVGTWLTLFWVIICVILIVGLAYWFTKHVAGRGLGGFGLSKGSDQFKVLARLSMGKDQQIALVQAGERYFLLGVTPSAISTLAELTKEEAGSWTQKPDRPAPPSFRESLRIVLQQKRQR